MGSTKSCKARAVVKIFHGADADLGTSPREARDLQALGTRSFVVGLDNLDGPIDDEIQDTMAASVTGARMQTRRLYTDHDIIDRRIGALFVITSRTGHFCQRPDMADRVLPLFPDAPAQMIDEGELYADLLASRDGILTYLARQAARALGKPPRLGDSGNRFVGLGHFLAETTGYPEQTGAYVDAWSMAKRLAVSDLHPLPAAILEYLRPSDQLGSIPRVLRGTATDIVRLLEEDGHAIPHLGGGKRIAGLLAECESTLRLSGVIVERQKYANRRVIMEFRRNDTV
jgi:hypothetical protein